MQARPAEDSHAGEHCAAQHQRNRSDTSSAHHIVNIVRASGPLGTTCILSGISPAVAQTIVTLDLELATTTASTLRHALNTCIARTRDRAGTRELSRPGERRPRG